MVRAEKLVSGLSSESERWKVRAAELEADFENLVGNILISAGYISYLGPFTLPYRYELLNQWIKLTQDLGIRVSKNFSLERVLVSEVEVREWTLAGLPADPLSKDNAIMITRCKRWPLIIDP